MVVGYRKMYLTIQQQNKQEKERIKAQGTPALFEKQT